MKATNLLAALGSAALVSAFMRIPTALNPDGELPSPFKVPMPGEKGVPVGTTAVGDFKKGSKNPDVTVKDDGKEVTNDSPDIYFKGEPKQYSSSKEGIKKALKTKTQFNPPEDVVENARPDDWERFFGPSWESMWQKFQDAQAKPLAKIPKATHDPIDAAKAEEKAKLAAALGNDKTSKKSKTSGSSSTEEKKSLLHQLKRLGTKAGFVKIKVPEKDKAAFGDKASATPVRIRLDDKHTLTEDGRKFQKPSVIIEDKKLEAKLEEFRQFLSNEKKISPRGCPSCNKHKKKKNGPRESKDPQKNQDEPSLQSRAVDDAPSELETRSRDNPNMFTSATYDAKARLKEGKKVLKKLKEDLKTARRTDARNWRARRKRLDEITKANRSKQKKATLAKKRQRIQEQKERQRENRRRKAEKRLQREEDIKEMEKDKDKFMGAKADKQAEKENLVIKKFDDAQKQRLEVAIKTAEANKKKDRQNEADALRIADNNARIEAQLMASAHQKAHSNKIIDTQMEAAEDARLKVSGPSILQKRTDCPCAKGSDEKGQADKAKAETCDCEKNEPSGKKKSLRETLRHAFSNQFGDDAWVARLSKRFTPFGIRPRPKGPRFGQNKWYPVLPASIDKASQKKDKGEKQVIEKEKSNKKVRSVARRGFKEEERELKEEKEKKLEQLDSLGRADDPKVKEAKRIAEEVYEDEVKHKMDHLVEVASNVRATWQEEQKRQRDKETLEFEKKLKEIQKGNKIYEKAKEKQVEENLREERLKEKAKLDAARIFAPGPQIVEEAVKVDFFNPGKTEKESKSKTVAEIALEDRKNLKKFEGAKNEENVKDLYKSDKDEEKSYKEKYEDLKEKYEDRKDNSKGRKKSFKDSKKDFRERFTGHRVEFWPPIHRKLMERSERSSLETRAGNRKYVDPYHKYKNAYAEANYPHKQATDQRRPPKVKSREQKELLEKLVTEAKKHIEHKVYKGGAPLLKRKDVIKHCVATLTAPHEEMHIKRYGKCGKRCRKQKKAAMKQNKYWCHKAWKYSLSKSMDEMAHREKAQEKGFSEKKYPGIFKAELAYIKDFKTQKDYDDEDDKEYGHKKENDREEYNREGSDGEGYERKKDYGNTVFRTKDYGHEKRSVHPWMSHRMPYSNRYDPKKDDSKKEDSKKEDSKKDDSKKDDDCENAQDWVISVSGPFPINTEGESLMAKQRYRNRKKEISERKKAVAERKKAAKLEKEASERKSQDNDDKKYEHAGLEFRGLEERTDNLNPLSDLSQHTHFDPEEKKGEQDDGDELEKVMWYAKRPEFPGDKTRQLGLFRDGKQPKNGNWKKVKEDWVPKDEIHLPLRPQVVNF